MKRTRTTVIVLTLLALSAGPVLAGDTLVIPKGTEVHLVLLHHLNSKYSPAGTPVYLAVDEPVVVDGQAVIPRHGVVEGRVSRAATNGRAGRAGSIEIEVERVAAADGTPVPLDARLSSRGRDRFKTAGRLTVAFGFSGLFTKGRMAFIERGTTLTATVSEDTEIDPDSVTGGVEDASRPAARQAQAVIAQNDRVLAIEKGKALREVDVVLETPDGCPLTDAELQDLALVDVNGMPVPEPIRPTTVDPRTRDRDRNSLPEHTVSFAGWDILRYCDEGDSRLTFRTGLDDGSLVEAIADLRLTIKKKGGE